MSSIGNNAIRVCVIFVLIPIFACTHVPIKDHPGASSQLTNQPSVNGMYGVQLAAFSSRERADEYERKLEASGVESYVIQDTNGLWTVRTGHFISQAQALAQAKNLLDQQMIDDYFVVHETGDTVTQDIDPGAIQDLIVNTAEGYLGTRYKWGGTSSKRGFDCSGFTMTVYGQHGIKLPRSSSSQFLVGKAVQKDELKKGDLVFFSTGKGSRISHVGIYSGDGKFIHASTTEKCIRIANMAKPYYQKRYRGARRVIVTQ